MLIITLMTAVAAGAMRSTTNPDREIDRLVLVLDMAAEQARVRGSPLRFELRPHGYRFSRLDTSGEWQIIEGDVVLGERELPMDFVLDKITRDGQDAPQGLVMGSDVALFVIEGKGPQGPFALVGEATGSVKKRIPILQ